MITDSAKEKIVTQIIDDLQSGSLGTSSQVPSASDTDLISEVTSTIQSVTASQNGKQMVITYNLDSITGNDETYTEYGNKFTTEDVLLNRITFTGVPKNSALEFQVKTIINVP